MKKDSINPQHYKSGGMEVIDVIESFGLGSHRSHALKYLLRAGRKDCVIQDLKKCMWWVEREIKVLKLKGVGISDTPL